jgi:hypothetical protein
VARFCDCAQETARGATAELALFLLPPQNTCISSSPRVVKNYATRRSSVLRTRLSVGGGFIHDGEQSRNIWLNFTGGTLSAFSDGDGTGAKFVVQLPAIQVSTAAAATEIRSSLKAGR